ncbi:hypothetical protein [Photobacterium damselae]|uniref:hypothetical protein n=1 Tax=Photobacterium damselae TaxID=38293 RepID=UPI001F33336E|nr:hypothetical protein [Photobacterium damselae]UKA04598.1 hypothetical protein IHC89_23555 [Photobacterium damselae subsp. damselae]
MFKKKDVDWGDESSHVNKPLLYSAVVGALIFLGVGYSVATSKVTASDARLAFIKQDYAEAMSDIVKIEDSDDSDQILAALDVKYQILLDKNSGYYDLNGGYNILKRVFMTNKNINDASTLLQLAYRLNKPFSDKQIYLEYLSNSGVGSYTSELIQLYLSSDDSYVREKAYKLLQREPISVNRNISMAKILIEDMGSKRDILQGISLLLEAGLMGSPEAEAELAMAYVRLISVSNKGRLDGTLSGKFARAINKSILMGYRGHLLDEAMLILRDGKYGIQQNLVLANEILKIRKGAVE